MLEKLLFIRRVEEEIIARYPKQLMRCPVHLSCGQEAVAVGLCHHLRKEDSVFSTHRNHAHYLAKGGDLEKMIFEIHGKDGCNGGRGGSMHLLDTSVNFFSCPIVASAIPLAVGAALANKLDGNDNIVVCFLGDAAVEEGVFSESLNFASLMKLPIIFVCENNQYSVDTPLSKRQPKRDIKNLGEAHNVTSISMDGHNVVEIADRFKGEIDFVRKHSLPVFAVIDTARSYVHCGVDKEFELAHDPLDATKDMDDTEIMARIKTAFDEAEIAPFPSHEMAKEFVYA